VTHFIEIGPRDVLTKLVKRIDDSVKATSFGELSLVVS
jgi:malonyl CoA-acyl carrier protein transacylase